MAARSGRAGGGGCGSFSKKSAVEEEQEEDLAFAPRLISASSFVANRQGPGHDRPTRQATPSAECGLRPTTLASRQWAPFWA